MIILEGPDGGGKSILAGQLLDAFPNLEMRARSIPDKDGPRDGPELFDWAEADVRSWWSARLGIYDRHPLVSEYIYGPIVRGCIRDPRFLTTGLRRRLVANTLLVVCLPHLSVVRASVSDDRDMPGVAAHIDALWHAYASLRATWDRPEGLLIYDYTTMLPDRLFPHIRSYCYRWDLVHHG